MRDVAALAGVSLKTVSRVVNGEPTVAEDLVERVRAASAQLSYQPNLTASNLRRGDGKSSTIGLLVEDVANPFSAAIFRAVEDVATSAGVSVRRAIWLPAENPQYVHTDTHSLDKYKGANR